MEYTTERGVVVEVLPIPLLLDAIYMAHPAPELPVYVEHMAGGAERQVPITREVAKAWQENDPDTWAEYADAWAEYETAYRAWQDDVNDKQWLATLKRAIKVTLPKDGAWIKDQESFGLTVPADPEERRLHYIRTEAIGSIRDILKISALANGSDMGEEALSLAEASFRGSLARSLLAGLAGARWAVDSSAPDGAHRSRPAVGQAAE